MDILLQVGIDVSSLKSARTQIASEIQSWKFPQTEKAPIIDEKQIQSATKAAKSLSDEVVRVTESYKPTAQEEQAVLLAQQTEQSEKLAKATAYNKLQNEALGPSIATVRSELNTYLRAQASGVPLTDKEIARKNELTATYKKMEKATKGLFHGLDFGRLIAWGIGWQLIYGTLRLVTGTITQSIKSWVDFGTSIARVSTVTRQAGMDHDSVMKAMTFTALEYSRKTSVAATDVAKTMYHLGSAGLTAKESIQGFEHVLSLTVGTFGNVDQVSRLVASSYILFGDKITHVTGISEKFQYISDVLAATYRDHQVELSEIASAFTYTGGAASLLDIKFEELVGTIGFLNDGMLKGSKAGTALMQSFVALGDKTDRLREEFGVVWDISKPIDFIDVMTQLKNSIGDSAQSTIVFSQLISIFGTRGSRAIVQILNRWDEWQEAIKMLPRDVEGASKKMQDIIEEAVGGALAKVKNQIQAIATTILTTLEPQILETLKIISASLTSGELFETAANYGKVLIPIFGYIYDIAFAITKAVATLHWILAKTYITIKNTAWWIAKTSILANPLVLFSKESKEQSQDYVNEIEKTLISLDKLPLGDEMSQKFKKNLEEMLIEYQKTIGEMNKEQEKSKSFSFEVSKKLLPKEQIATLEKMYDAISEETSKRVLLEKDQEAYLEIQSEKMKKIKDQIILVEATETSYTKKLQKANLELSRQHEINLLNARGVDESIIKQREFISLLEMQVEYLKDTFPKLTVAELKFDIETKSIEELAEKYRKEFSDPDLLKEFKENLYAITEVFEKEIGDLASSFQSATTDYVKNLLAGTGDIKDFIASIVDAYQTAFAERIGQMIADTGIFEGMANAFLSPMQKMYKNIYDAMVEGSIVAAKNLKDGVSGKDIAGATDTANKQSAFGGMLSSIGTFLGISKESKVETKEIDEKQLDAAKKTAESTSKLAQGVAAAGKVASVGMGLYSGYQGVMAASQQGGIQGALGGAMSGAAAGSMFGPIGTAVGAIAGGLFGAFGGKKQSIPDQIKESTIELKSAISISNKELQLITRNTEAMRRGFEGFQYIIPRSAWFSSDEANRFNLDRQRSIL